MRSRAPFVFVVLAAAVALLAACGEARPVVASSPADVCTTCHVATEDGAHDAHLLALSGDEPCTQCHPGPAGVSPEHLDGDVDLAFGALATGDGTLASSFDPGARTCATVYCHGAFDGGNAANAPVWRSGQGDAGCGTCHAIPAATAAHGAHVEGGSDLACAECHPDPLGGSTAHVDGRVDVAFGPRATRDGALASSFAEGARTCATVYCHGAFAGGNAANAPAWGAGPAGAACGSCHGTPGTTGAHGAHAQALGGNACAECHPGSEGATHVDGRVDVAFGALATRDGALASGFDPVERSCAAVYCHGAFAGGKGANAPAWGAGSAGATCGSCHGTPAATGAHGAHAEAGALACTECHPDPLGGAVHVDGQVDLAFGALATRDGALATGFDPAARSCATVYCHGAFAGGNALNAPGWESGAAGSACGSCHPVPAATGAHGAHVQAGGLACTACHPDPQGGAVHVDGRVDLAFGALATRDGALVPGFDPVARTCATVYCHGAFAGGSAANAPAWGAGPAGAECGSCHGTPSATGAHAAHVQVLGQLACAECHPEGGAATHVDGRVDVPFGPFATRDGALASGFDPASKSCATVYCHGAFTGGNAANAPEWGSGPAGGACGTCHGTPPETGAHAAHARALGPAGCTECHPAPGGAAAVHVDGRVDVAFGARATAGGTLPSSFDPASKGCASVYCHGAFPGGSAANEPTWMAGAAGGACGTCHALPPAATHAGVTSDLSGCVRCHATSVDATGAILAGGTHADGVRDGGHEAAWMDETSAGFHGPAAKQGLSDCQGCHGEGLEGGSAVACAECHGTGGVLACASCHGALAAAATAARSAHFRAADPSADCRTCHDAFPPQGGHYRLPAPGGGFPDDTCVSCHTGAGETLDGRTPPLLVHWTDTVDGDWHGARAGTGSGGTLKAPYVRGQGPLPCRDCHGQHSGPNAFLFASSVNGTAVPAGSISRAGVGAEKLCSACHAGSWHASCAGCHPTSSDRLRGINGPDPVPAGSPCFRCHGHEGIVVWYPPVAPTPDCDNCHDIAQRPLEAVPPVVTVAPTVTAITATTATIRWSTDEKATSYVEYGVGSPRHATGSFDVFLHYNIGAPGNEHTVTLTGLSPGTTYVWRVRSSDEFRNVRVSTPLRTFTTPSP